ncbi:histidine kinase [Pontibacillus halophilus JSM 076056 = DSM 19796]|uniref:histidine kinase n=1 Tax=Pontibacillus halophilus JSM 076056 = DSM 19796 TaxID=1385510 RepID=A0A0A5GKH4_9BACI|nr:HAMP domain-containing sensor histidine kinase [Pontibacillus halophilus]KGX93786.1 histidine kinase [Pontibacillus halophilus JSM 076056 = DSM 19796]
MKLLYQLNAAFTALLVIIMSATAFFVYTLLFDILVEEERKELNLKGQLLVNIINEENYFARNEQFARLIQDNEFQLMFYDIQNEQIVQPTTLERDVAQQIAGDIQSNVGLGGLYESEEGDFVISPLTYQTRSQKYVMVLATPIEQLRSLQALFAGRMAFVFLIGIAVAIAFSYLLTKRFVTPLTKLKKELKKIEKRQFTAVEKIGASGEIGEVEQTVMDMAQELERYIRTQKQFFQNASHELKTPLMSIQGYAEGIRDGIFTEDSADRGLTVIVNESERLKKIVNEIILLAKLDSEEDLYHPTIMTNVELLQRTEERVVPVANEKGISLLLRVDEELSLSVDEEKLLQALMNVVTNGIRHATTYVELSTFRRKEWIVFQIQDDGDGISEDVMHQLFHRFMKGKDGETGLGLAISRAIVERSQGRIEAFNNKEGAVFQLSFPIVKEERSRTE